MKHNINLRVSILTFVVFVIVGFSSTAKEQSDGDEFISFILKTIDEMENTYVDPDDYYTTNLGVVLYELKFRESEVEDSVEKIFDEFMKSDYVRDFVDPVYNVDQKYVFAYANENILSFTFWRRPNYPILSYRIDRCYWGYITLGGIDIPVYGSVNLNCDFLILNHVSNPQLFPFYIDPYVNSDTFDINVPRPKLDLTIKGKNIRYRIYLKEHFC